MTDRPRDRLGRPLPAHSPDAFPGVAPHPGISADDAWHLAMQYVHDDLPFHAHEVFEQRWRCCPIEERPLWQGLAQWTAAVTHQRRGNAVGAASVARKAEATLDQVALDDAEAGHRSATAPVDLDLVRRSLRALRD